VIASRPSAALPIGAQPVASAPAGITGALGVTDGADTLVASGVLTASGSLAQTDGTDSLAASGTLTSAGTLALTDGADTLVADGTVGASSITGDLNATDGTDLLSASGSTGGATIELLGGGPGGPKRKGRPEKGSYWERLLSPPLQDRLEAIEPEAAEVIEAVAQVAVVNPAAQEAEMRRALEQAGIAYREAYVEIYTELLAEMRRQQDDEDEVLLLMMA
jgi:hypothetical protein